MMGRALSRMNRKAVATSASATASMLVDCLETTWLARTGIFCRFTLPLDINRWSNSAASCPACSAA